MPWGPYFSSLPVDGGGKRYVDSTSWDAVVDNFVNWKDNVNGGGYTLSNVAISASSVFAPIVLGGTLTTSTLTLRATSGAGATGADIVFETGNNGATEALRITNSGSSNFGKIWTSGVRTTGNATLSYGDLVSFGSTINGASLTWDAQTNSGNASVMARLRPRWLAGSRYALDVFVGGWNNAYDPGPAVATFQSTGNCGMGTATPAQRLEVYGATSLPATSGTTQNGLVRIASTATNAIDFGLADASPFGAWIQTSNVAALGTTYPLLLNPNGGPVGIGMSNPTWQLQLSTDSAAKPSTNTWTIVSDGRLKTVLGNYERGLDAVCALRPVRYQYNGLGGMPADGKEHVSIVAQELIQVFPECVGMFRGRLEQDSPEIDLYSYNGHAITFAVINAIKQLKTEIDNLKKMLQAN